MKSMTCHALMAALACPMIASSASAEDWPQFRGPNRNGITSEANWSIEGQAEPLWTKTVGLGYSGMSVGGGRLFTLGYDEQAGEDVLYCLDAMTGAEIWTHRYPSQIWNRAHRGGTLSTPSIDGEHVYFSDREGKFICFEAATGKVVWSKALQEEFSLEYPTWGFAAAPLVLDDMVVMNVNRVIAFDKKTGSVIWKTEKDYGDCYSTPVEFDLNGKTCLAVFNLSGLTILEKADGKELHFQEWLTPRANVNAAAPIVFDGDKVFISSGYNHGCAVVDLSGESARIVWENKIMRNHMNASTLWNGHLYGFDEAVFKCIDLEGNEKWAQRGLGKAAHIIADGKLVIVSSKGELVIAEATPEEYRELHRVDVLSNPDNVQSWTTPVLANGLIYCRNSNGYIVCRDHRAAASGAGTN
jgi:outer membrane protein assembly factor BamB